MEFPLHNQSGEQVGSVMLPPEIFEIPIKIDLIHQVLSVQESNARNVIAHTKGRSEVRGGGKKPWRQKGTGRARHASIRSPIWKGGGVAFGPTKERNFSGKINKKMIRKALAMVLSAKVRDRELFVIEGISLPEAKTKQASQMLKKLFPHSRSILVVTPKKDSSVERAIRNIPGVGVISADSLNVRDILSRKYLMLDQQILPELKSMYSL